MTRFHHILTNTHRNTYFKTHPSPCLFADMTKFYPHNICQWCSRSTRL